MYTEKATHLIRYYGKVKFAAMLNLSFKTLARRLKENDWNAGHKAVIERESFKLSQVFSEDLL